MNKIILSSGLLVFLFFGSVVAMDSNEWENKLNELNSASSATKAKIHAGLIADNRLLSFKLSHRFDHDDLVQAAKPLKDFLSIIKN